MCYVSGEAKPLIVLSGFEPIQQVTPANARRDAVCYRSPVLMMLVLCN